MTPEALIGIKIVNKKVSSIILFNFSNICEQFVKLACVLPTFRPPNAKYIAGYFQDLTGSQLEA